MASYSDGYVLVGSWSQHCLEKCLENKTEEKTMDLLL